MSVSYYWFAFYLLHVLSICAKLHVAAANGYMQVAEFLLKQGASVELEDRDGWLPIHIAACWGYVRSRPDPPRPDLPTHALLFNYTQ